MPSKKPDELKKRKLTLTCKPQTVEFLSQYCYKHGISISQLLDNHAIDLMEKEEKLKRAELRKNKSKQTKSDDIAGQMNISDVE